MTIKRDEMKGIIGVMPRTTAFPASLRLTGVARLHADLRGVNAPHESVRELLDTASLGVAADLRMGEITEGQRRRLWLALALVDDPSRDELPPHPSPLSDAVPPRRRHARFVVSRTLQ